MSIAVRRMADRTRSTVKGFDLCVSRAVANLSVLAEYCLPFIKVGGRLAALKGPMPRQRQSRQRAH